MFTQLIFIIVLLLLSSFTTVNTDRPLFYSYLVFYGVLLGYNIYRTKTWKPNQSNRKETLNFNFCLQLVIYISFFSIFIGFPYFRPFHSTILVVFIFGLYFFGIFIFNLYYAAKRHSTRKALDSIFILIPFILPLMAYTFINDLLFLAGYNLEAQPYYVLAMFGLMFMSLLLLFLPPVLLFFWRCKPLKDANILSNLQHVCSLAKFKHGGFKIWTVLNHTPTAAIIGILSKFRYVMFTKAILKALPVNALEAVLAHEIGHSKRRHLLKLPFVLLGMGVLATWVLFFLGSRISSGIATLEKLYPSAYWYEAEVALLFLLSAFTAAFYIRYVFGYFSRMYEKEADLYGLEIGLPASGMIDALETIAVETGNSHERPSWHHDSLGNRIRYIQRAEQNPKVIAKLHQKATLSLIGYSLCLAIAIAVLVL